MGNPPGMNWPNTVETSDLCGGVGERGGADRRGNDNTSSTLYSATNSVTEKISS